MRQIRNNDSSANSPNCFTTCHLCWGGIDLSYLYAKTLHGSTLLLAGSITELPDIGHSKNIHMMEMSQKPYIEMIFLSRSGYHIFNSKTLPIKVNIIIKYSTAFLKISLFFRKEKLVEMRTKPHVSYVDWQLEVSFSPVLFCFETVGVGQPDSGSSGLGLPSTRITGLHPHAQLISDFISKPCP